jgi:hypothetical protein
VVGQYVDDLGHLSVLPWQYCPVRPELRYVELKTGFDGNGPASISWVFFSKTGRTVY